MQRETHATCDIRLETHRGAHRLILALHVVFMLTLFLGLTRQATAAPEKFSASGSFEDEHGGQLSGTLTIDTATGKLVSADLVITEVEEKDKKIVFTNLTARSVNGVTRITGIGTGFADIQLTLPESTLVGYQGGQIEPGTSSWAPYGEGFGVIGFGLTSGTLEPK
jgi:hypothetical protein